MASVQVDPIMFGQVIERLDGLSKQVGSIDAKLDKELAEIKATVEGKPTMDEVKRELREYGLDDPKESKKDAEYLRAQRLKSENNAVIKQRVVIALFTAAALAIGTWTWKAVTNQIKDDVRQEQHP